MLCLSKLQEAYELNQELVNQIKFSLNYDSKTTMAGLDEFITQLPVHLRMAVTLAIHDKIFKAHPLMK